MYFSDALVSTGISVLFYITLRFFFTKFITKEPFDVFTSRGFVATGLLAVIMFSINYFWVDSGVEKKAVEQTVVSGQSFTAPEMVAVQKPLQLDLQFEKQADVEVVKTQVDTDVAQYIFSSHGACLESMDLLWQKGSVHVPVVEAANPSCMIGLSGVTPFDYELVAQHDHDTLDAYVIEYKSRFDGGIIHKTFVVYKKTYQIDVKVAVASAHRKEATEQIRLFVASPLMTEELKGVVNKPGAGATSLYDVVLSKPQAFTDFWFEPKIFGFTTKFLTSICFAASEHAVGRTYFKKLSDTQQQFILESQVVPAGTEISWSLYVGPKTSEALYAVAPDLTHLMQYGWLTPIAKPVLRLMTYLHQETGSYGLAIIIIALLIKLLLLPFTLKSERSMKQQAEFEKKRAHLQQKFKHDKAALDQATAELINKYGFPMLSGCLPMLLNIPVFLALNKVLSSAIQLHGAPFLWLPDLSVADPYYILSMMVFVAMVLSPAASSDPRQWMSRIGFALFLGAVTAYLASGLALFIMMNTVLGVAQTYAVRNIRWLAA